MDVLAALEHLEEAEEEKRRKANPKRKKYDGNSEEIDQGSLS